MLRCAAMFTYQKICQSKPASDITYVIAAGVLYIVSVIAAGVLYIVCVYSAHEYQVMLCVLGVVSGW